jgi:integrase
VECSPEQRISPEQYEIFMETLLQDTAALEARHLRSRGTMQLYHRTHREFSAWMAYVYGSASTGWARCDPSDVLAYLRHVVPMLHSGRGAPGQPIVASTLRKIVSALSRCFELRERGATWDSKLGGNPTKSSLVSSWVDTFSHMRRDAGDTETSAVPMTRQKMHRLLDAIEANIDAETDRLRAEPLPDSELGRLLRDAAILALLWHGKRRGQDMLNLRWGRLFVQRETVLVPVLEAWTAHPWAREARCTGTLVCLPSRTKTAQDSRPGSVVVPATPDADANYCAVQRLRTYFTWLLDSQGEVSPEAFVFHNSTRAAQWASTALASRFKALLARYCLDEGETVHGIRRGTMQHAYASGVPVLEIMQQACIVTPGICSRYLDIGRHL